MSWAHYVADDKDQLLVVVLSDGYLAASVRTGQGYESERLAEPLLFLSALELQAYTP
jgi:hypothetical protein